MNERFARASLRARVDLAHEPDFLLGRAEVRPARREIACDGSRETVEPRVMRALVALARAKGDILSRDDLIESCWDSVIVGEDAINRCMGRLRKAGEASGNAFSIETVPRVGYRLKITEKAADGSEANDVAATGSDFAATAGAPIQSPAPAEASLLTRTRWSAAIVAAGVCVLLVTGLGYWWFWPRAAVAPVAPEASVAVLPFVNMSGDPSKEYFSDGFSEELLNDLSSDPHLRVVARTSAFAFRGRSGDTQAIAHALHVRTIVEGSVREVGNRLRITAQLIDAGNGYNIWSASYDRNLSDILSVQDEVARAVAAALTHRIVLNRASARRTIDPAVYRLYLQAHQYYMRLSPDGIRRAFALYTEVTTRQPDFADGFASLSDAAYAHVDFEPAHAGYYVAIATEAAQKALSLDPRNVKARQMRALLELHAWNWAGATADFRALRAENPNDRRVLAGLRIYFKQLGFPNEAIAVMRHAVSLDPLSIGLKDISLSDLLMFGHSKEAIDMARAMLAREPNESTALFGLCSGYARMGQQQAARAFEVRLRHVNSNESQEDSSIEDCDFDIDINSGSTAEARKILQKWEAEFPDNGSGATSIAVRYVQLRDFDRASDWYERAYDRREDEFLWNVNWAAGAKYRTTLRWQALTQQPLFREWQAEHDRIAAELAARGGAP